MYLCEAHALDSWPLSPAAPVNHRSLADRQAAGEAFLRQWPAFAEQLHAWYIDGMDDGTTIANGLWPERYVVLKGGRATWASAFSEDGPLPVELRAAAAAAFG